MSTKHKLYSVNITSSLHVDRVMSYRYKKSSTFEIIINTNYKIKAVSEKQAIRLATFIALYELDTIDLYGATMLFSSIINVSCIYADLIHVSEDDCHDDCWTKEFVSDLLDYYYNSGDFRRTYLNGQIIACKQVLRGAYEQKKYSIVSKNYLNN